MPDSTEGNAAGSTQSPGDPPAVIVHGLEAAVAAVGATDPARGIVLVSAPGAGMYGGAGWFAALCRQAAATRPEIAVRSVLDCADAPGAVLAALRVGLPTIVFTGEITVASQLGRAAAEQGARILCQAPRALDLAGFRAGSARWQRRLKEWLARGAG